MGASDLRDAFNSVAAEAGFTAARAELSYEKDDTVQWQRLTFRGTDGAGQPFVKRSDRLRPETDVIQAARAVARQMVEEAGGAK